ncbi:MAG: hydrogenase subunit MbhD domain-containing protein, partial [Hyphomicrobiaceae bacterium]
MSLLAAFDICLAATTIVIALWTTVVRSTFPAIVGFVIYGLLLALVWVRLSAVDVALTEAAIGSGITGVLLLSAAARLRGNAVSRSPLGLKMRVLTAILCAAVTAGLAAVVLLPPDPIPTLAPRAMAYLDTLQIGNGVAAVLKAYRALDTLLEAVVLLIALVGVWSLAPDDA